MFTEQSSIEMRRGVRAWFQLECTKEPPGLTRRQRIKRRRLLRKQIAKYQIALQREWNTMWDRLIADAVTSVLWAAKP